MGCAQGSTASATIRRASTIRQHPEANGRRRELFALAGALLEPRAMGTIRFASRSLVRHPGWAALTIAVLALGLGSILATSTISTALSTPLPYEPENRIFVVTETRRDVSGREVSSNVIRRLGTLDSVELAAGYMKRASDRVVTVDGRSQTVRTALVTENFFRVLGVTPRAGRFFVDDKSPGLVLSSPFWDSRFASDTAVIGKLITRDGFVNVPVPVLGVAPPRVNLPSPVDCWSRVNLRFEWSDKSFIGIVRVKPGHSVEALQSQLDSVIGPEARAAGGQDDAATRLRAQPLRAFILGEVESTTDTLAIVAYLVFLIGSFNAFVLFAFRTNERRSDLVLCSALGASRGWVASVVLIEITLLFALATVIASVLAGIVTTIGLRLLSLDLPRISWTAGLADPSVLLVAGGLLGAGVGYAAIIASRSESGSRGAIGTGRRILRVSGQSTLILTQTIVAVVLVAVAATSYREYREQSESTTIPSEDSLVIVRLRHVLASNTSDANYPYEAFARGAASLVAQLEAAIRVPVAAASLFGVADVGESHLVHALPVTHLDSGGELTVIAVTPPFFELAGVSIVAGRGFQEADRLGTLELQRRVPGRSGATIVSDRAARQLFGNESALDRRVSIADDFVDARTIVGVAADVPPGLTPNQLPVVFVPYRERPSQRFVLLARPEAPLKGRILDVIRDYGPSVALVRMATAEAERALHLEKPTAVSRLTGLVSVSAVFLTCAAIVGIVRLTAGSREAESALRVALGATQSSVVSLIVKPFAISVVIGAGIASAILLVLGSQTSSPLLLSNGNTLPVLVGASAGSIMLLALLCMVVVARRAGTRIASLLRA